MMLSIHYRRTKLLQQTVPRQPELIRAQTLTKAFRGTGVECKEQQPEIPATNSIGPGIRQGNDLKTDTLTVGRNPGDAVESDQPAQLSVMLHSLGQLAQRRQDETGKD